MVERRKSALSLPALSPATVRGVTEILHSDRDLLQMFAEDLADDAGGYVFLPHVLMGTAATILGRKYAAGDSEAVAVVLQVVELVDARDGGDPYLENVLNVSFAEDLMDGELGKVVEADGRFPLTARRIAVMRDYFAQMRKELD